MHPPLIPALPHALSRVLYDSAVVPAAWLGYHVASLFDAESDSVALCTP